MSCTFDMYSAHIIHNLFSVVNVIFTMYNIIFVSQGNVIIALNWFIYSYSDKLYPNGYKYFLCIIVVKNLWLYL